MNDRLPVLVSPLCSCSRLKFAHHHNSRCKEYVYSFAEDQLEREPVGRTIPWWRDKLWLKEQRENGHNAPQNDQMPVRKEVSEPKGKTPAPGRHKKRVG